MPDYSKESICLHDTEMFKEWMSEKGYFWPTHPWEQENMIAEFMREGLEMAC